MSHTLASVALLALAGSPLYASFLVSLQTVTFYPQTQMVSFALEFNEAPDFYTVDDLSRPANAWQIRAIRAGGSYATQDFYDSIERTDAGRIVVQTMPSGSSQTNSIMEVPYLLRGTTITFEAPVSAIAPSHPDGIFEFELLTWDYGSVHEADRYFFSEAVSAPEPSNTAALGIFSLIAIALRYRAKRPSTLWIAHRGVVR